MKYLCLVYVEEKKLSALSQGDWDALMNESTAYREVLQASGHHLACDPLEPVRAAVTVRMRNGKLSTTDGPFAETKEQLGGYFLLEARDLNEAIQLAAKIPPARLGSVEVRPIRASNDQP